MAKRKSEDDPEMQHEEKAQKLGPFQKKGNHDNEIILRFEDGRELYASSAFLKMISPVFKAMLERNFKEKTTGVVDLKEKNYEDFLNFLHLCHSTEYRPVTVVALERFYSKIMEKITALVHYSIEGTRRKYLLSYETNVFKIIPLVEEYQVPLAIEACKYVLLSVIHSYRKKVNVVCYKRGEDKDIRISKSTFEVLKNLLTLLAVASDYSYRDFVCEVSTLVARFPCSMYLEGKRVQNYYGVSVSDAKKECEDLFNYISGDVKSRVLTERLRKSFNE